MSVSQIRSSNNIAIYWAIVSKFGGVIDVNIAKQVLLLKPKPRVYFQLHMAAIFKILEIDMTS